MGQRLRFYDIANPDQWNVVLPSNPLEISRAGFFGQQILLEGDDRVDR